MAYVGSGRRVQTASEFNPAGAFNSVLSPTQPARVQEPTMMAKGFSNAPPAPPPPTKKSKQAAKAKEAEARMKRMMDAERPVQKKTAGVDDVNAKAAADFDRLKASGAPQYMVFVRECPNGTAPSKWFEVGEIAVPRTSSVDKALAMAIYQNEKDLLKGAFKKYPSLKVGGHRLEYGWRLVEFPDDEVMVATKEQTEPEKNPFVRWINNLDSGLNDGSSWFSGR